MKTGGLRYKVYRIFNGAQKDTLLNYDSTSSLRQQVHRIDLKGDYIISFVFNKRKSTQMGRQLLFQGVGRRAFHHLEHEGSSR